MGGIKTISPSPRYYAVIRMDPETMIRVCKLDDEQALKEVGAMRPQKYLIYLAQPEALPMPKDKWTRFRVSPIGTTLRPADSEKDITPEMVTPIAPNTQNTRGRQPVHTMTPFPFANCYHWVDNNISVRVKVRPGHFDHEHAVRMASVEHLALIQSFANDYKTIAAARRKRREDASHATPSEGSESDSGSSSNSSTRSSSRPESLNGVTREVEAPSTGSVHSATPSSSSSCATTIDPIPQEDIFGLSLDPKHLLVPLVDLWLELDEHLSEDTIPSPVGLSEEKKTIQSIMARAAERMGRHLEEPFSSPETTPPSSMTSSFRSAGAPEGAVEEKHDAPTDASAEKNDVVSQPEDLPAEQAPRRWWSPLRSLKRAMCMG